MRRLILVPVMCLLLAACGPSPAGQQAGSTPAATPVEGQLEIKGTCAVIYTPAAGKLSELKTAFGEKDFQGLAAANDAALKTARQYLQQQGIRILETSQYLLHFVKENGTSVSINLNRPKYAWEVFLFDGKNDPIKADLTNIQGAYEEMKGRIIQ